MATSYGALCTDFYVEQKLALKMDLPSDREPILHFFDQFRRRMPAMNRFRRYDGELLLESTRRSAEYQWLALRRNSVRSGFVNPDTLDQAYAMHRLILETVPYHLTVSPLDVDYIELIFGFDLECSDNHDEVVYDALLANTPLGELLRVPDAEMLDVQPMFRVAFDQPGDLQATFEVRTRQKSRRGSSQAFRNEPISLFLVCRQYGPVDKVQDMQPMFDQLAHYCEKLANEKLIPNVLAPIARHITSSSA